MALSRQGALAAMVQALRARGFQNIAVLGSMARGDDSEGSDIDLWVLDEHAHREERMVEHHPITVIFEPVELVRANLARIEVSHARVLFDAGGRFAALKRLFRRQQSSLRRAIIAGTHDEVNELLEDSTRGCLASRLLSLRAAAVRVASLPTYLATNVRDPRWRHFETHYTAGTLSHLKVALGLEPRHLAALNALDWTSSELFLGAHAKWRCGAKEEALLKARHAVAELAGHSPFQPRARFERDRFDARWRLVQGLNSVSGHEVSRARNALRLLKRAAR